MRPNRPVFALDSWTVEERVGGWFYGLTYSEEPKEFRGPYKNLQAVALAISHQHIRTVQRRQTRLNAA